MFKIGKLNLLVVAAVVWLVAGANILNIGIQAYREVGVVPWEAVLSVAVGAVFWFFVFHRLTKKHTTRIVGYAEPRQHIWHFFDLKSFVIMAVMMTGGILIRTLQLAPAQFIAVFYTGLGASLALAGALFAVNRLRVRTAAAA